ncbi:MAG: DUF2095 family protein [Candidatus Bathyarchaeia archaeon]
MEGEKEKFRRAFPNLAKEMDRDRQEVAISSIRSDIKTGEKAAASQKNLSNYNPDIIDFLRRCDNHHQAEEIINYMESRGEITPNYAQKLRQQLQKKGLRSFGSKKEEGYYFKITKQ